MKSQHTKEEKLMLSLKKASIVQIKIYPASTDHAILKTSKKIIRMSRTMMIAKSKLLASINITTVMTNKMTLVMSDKMLM